MTATSTTTTTTTTTTSKTETKKRKRSTEPEPPELEIDLALPEPPSKKALRRAKKGKADTKPARSTTRKRDHGDDDDLLPDLTSPRASPPFPQTAPDTTITTTTTTGGNPPRPTHKPGGGGGNGKGSDPTTTAPRSRHGIWIGNLSFLTTPTTLRHFLTSRAGLSDAQITRLHLPVSTTRPLTPQQARRALTDALAVVTGREGRGSTGTGTIVEGKGEVEGEDDGEGEGEGDAKGPPVRAPKFQNKGFAYVDLDGEEAVTRALRVSEEELQGRKVLIKGAGDFAGRPEKEKGEDEEEVGGEVAAGVKKQSKSAGGGGEGQQQQQRPRSKKLFVGNLPFEADKEGLREHFEQAGEVEDVWLATFEDSGKCKGFGYVRFGQEEAAEAAVRGWVWKVEDDDAGEEEGDGDGEKDDEAGERKVTKGKRRKWWINRVHGRTMRIEYAEDATVRYQKRFGKKGRKDDHGDARADGDAAAASRRPTRTTERRTRATADERAEQRRKRHTDARKVAPGKALANAQRASGAIVQGQGKKVTFD